MRHTLYIIQAFYIIIQYTTIYRNIPDYPKLYHYVNEFSYNEGLIGLDAKFVIRHADCIRLIGSVFTNLF